MNGIIAESIKMPTGRIYLSSLNRRACCLAWLLLGFTVGLSGCKSPKPEETSKPKTEETRPKVKAGEAELVAIANKYVSEKGEDLNLYEKPEVSEHETYWDVFYDNKENDISRFDGDLSVIIDGQTLQPRHNDCYKLKIDDPKILEIANKFLTKDKRWNVDLSLYNSSIDEYKAGWLVSYRCKHPSFGCGKRVIISRTSCKPHIAWTPDR